MKSYSTQKVYELLYSWYQTTWLFLTFKMIIINKKRKITDQSSNFIVTYIHNLNGMRSPTIFLPPFLFVWLPLGSLCES